MDTSSEPWKKIKKTISSHSITSEYQALVEFTKLGYYASTYYYTDYDINKKQNIARELDFSAIKVIEMEHEKIKLNLWINFLGDVKYHSNYGKRIIVGLRNDPKSNVNLGVGAFNSIEWTSAIISIASKRVFNQIFFNLDVSSYPVCKDVLIFKDTGKIDDEIQGIGKQNQNKKRNYRAYCEQISSAINQRTDKGSFKDIPEDSNIQFITIPLLIFANNVQFIVGQPKEIENDQLENKSAIFYLFQSSAPSGNYLIPILMATLSKLPEIITSIENGIIKSFENPSQFKIWGDSLTKYFNSKKEENK